MNTYSPIRRRPVVSYRPDIDGYSSFSEATVPLVGPPTADDYCVPNDEPDGIDGHGSSRATVAGYVDHITANAIYSPPTVPAVVGSLVMYRNT